MNKTTAIFLFIISFNVFASEKIICPDGTKVLTEKGIYKERETTVHGCLNKDGELHGINIMMVNNTIINKCNYKNSLEHGECTDWYYSGEKKTTSNFKNGKLHGKLIRWHKNGNIEYQANYKNGKLINVLNK